MELKSTFISSILLFFAAVARGDGAWLNDPARLSISLLPRDFTPSFFIVKIGSFAMNGKLKVDFVYSSLIESCGKPIETNAWVTHKLLPLETFTADGGRKLGEDLARILGQTCFTAVELDIEPMPAPPDWLDPFVRAVRTKLPKEYRLRLAIPPVTERKTGGLSWTPAAARKVLEAVDGLDLMVYDSGPKGPADYEALIDDAIGFFSSVTSTSTLSEKQLVLGLPTYRDGDRKKHPVYIENLMVARTALQKLPKEKAHVLCNERVRIAYYASWTMEEKDRLVAKDLDAWKTALCKKK